jgi:hypothetical protein
MGSRNGQSKTNCKMSLTHLFEQQRIRNGITSYLQNVKITLGRLFIEKIKIEMSDGVKMALDKSKKSKSPM